MKPILKVAAIVALCITSLQGAWAQKKYGPGASDSEIKLGQTQPFSGPASAYISIAKVQLAYFKMLNEKGGINGRKVNLLSLDDAYSPPKTLEQVRRLVEQEEVLAIVGSLGTPTNAAVQKYLNDRKVPHLFLATGAARWNNPKDFPWTTPGFPLYAPEAAVYGKYIAQNFPNAKIGLLAQNDDSGRDYVAGLKKGLGARTSQIVKEVTFEVTDPSIDSQIIELKSAGVDVLFTNGIPKPMAQAIRKIAELGWKPTHFLGASSNAMPTMESAGLDNAKDVITTQFMKTVGDPAWEKDPEMQEYLKFMKERVAEVNVADSYAVIGYYAAHAITHILKQAGNDLTRENILKVATNINNVPLPMLLPGVTITVKPDNYSAFNTFQLARFDGKRWMLFGSAIKGD